MFQFLFKLSVKFRIWLVMDMTIFVKAQVIMELFKMFILVIFLFLAIVLVRLINVDHLVDIFIKLPIFAIKILSITVKEGALII